MRNILNINNLPDKQLYQLCKKYGSLSKIWKRKFEALLPEVLKRKLYKRRGYISIYEFAAKLCGLGREHVDEVLRVYEKLEDKPKLKKLIEEYGINKARLVANVATVETQDMWAEKLSTLPKSSLAICVQEYKNNNSTNSQIEFRAGTEPVSWTSINIKLDPETEFKLRLLKQKLEKQKREPITFNQVVKYMLEKIEKYKTDSETSQPENTKPRECSAENPISETVQLPADASRYIPAKIRNQIVNRFQHHCAYPGCNRPADEFHHVKRFASYRQHDPDSMVSLCKIHHKFAHSGLIKNELEEPEKWAVKI